MKSSTQRLFVAASMIAAFAVPTFAAKAKVGDPAPDFVLSDLAGTAHQLSDFVGKTVVLEWINPDCPFVKKHYDSGNLPSLQSQAAAADVVWLLINSGHPGAQGDYASDRAEAWLDKTGAAATAYLRDQDGTVGRRYGAKTTPHLFVVNPDGRLVYDGAIDSIPSARKQDIAAAENYVTAALAVVARGEMPAKTSSQPYGCSVKY